MDDELWSQLTDSEKDAWKKIEATLSSPGYALISRDIKEVATGLEQLVFQCQSWEQYQRTLGALEALQLLLNVDVRAMQQLQQAALERQSEEPPEAVTDAFV